MKSQRRSAMTARIFAYIAHKAGVVDDTAAELFAAAKKIDPAATPTAIVVGSGAELDAVCKTSLRSFPEVWKVTSDSLAYPNAELVRQALVKVVPQGCDRAGSAQSLRHRPRARTLDQAQRRFRLRRGRDRWRRRNQPQSRSPGIWWSRSARTCAAISLTAPW